MLFDRKLAPTDRSEVGPKLSDPTTFGDPTPYNIMFGPDKCGYTKRCLVAKRCIFFLGLMAAHWV
jgi:hypothetical protein